MQYNEKERHSIGERERERERERGRKGVIIREWGRLNDWSGAGAKLRHFAL